MTTGRTAILLGASGSVGEAVLDQLVATAAFRRIVVMTRRPLSRTDDARVVDHLVPDMAPDRLEHAVLDALRDIDGEVLGFSALGIGGGTARLTLAQHRAVDVDLNAAFARGLKASGKVGHLSFLSAVGADITAKTTGSGAAGMPRYLRVKGEAEAAVTAQGPAVVSLFRPAMIIGSRHTPKLLALLMPLVTPLLPARFKSITTTDIARAMVAAALQPPLHGAVYEHPGMMRLIAASHG